MTVSLTLHEARREISPYPLGKGADLLTTPLPTPKKRDVLTHPNQPGFSPNDINRPDWQNPIDEYLCLPPEVFPLPQPLFPPFLSSDLVPEIPSKGELEGKTKKELNDIAEQIRGKTLQNVRNAAREDIGSRQSGRSGNHSQVDTTAGNLLRQAASNLEKKHPLKEKLRTLADRLLDSGRGTNHPGGR